jgi:hypothetical protein
MDQSQKHTFHMSSIIPFKISKTFMNIVIFPHVACLPFTFSMSLK